MPYLPVASEIGTIHRHFFYRMAENKKKLLADKLFRFSIVFLIVYLLLNLVIPKPDTPATITDAISIKSLDDQYAEGQLVQIQVKNPTEKNITGTLTIAKRKDGEWEILPLQNNTADIAPKSEITLSYSDQNTKLFTDTGKYRATLSSADGKFLAENEFGVEKPGFFRSILQTLFFKPIYNLLIICLEIGKGHFFIAIILLTLIIKTLLIIPSKKAILSQQKMQKVQPEIEKLKKKHGSDPQKQAQEMMKLWKKHKVNPGAALVPTLIQFPVLIALFFVVKQGIMPHNIFLMYPLPFLENFDFSAINFHFLWLSLDKIDPYFILPVSIGLLQFWQMKSMQAKRKKQASKEKKEHSPQETVMNMMTYFLPIIVVIFSASLPSAVGLYWGTSTIFAIVQQRILQKNDDSGNDKKGKGENDNIVDVEIVEEEKEPKKIRIKA